MTCHLVARQIARAASLRALVSNLAAIITAEALLGLHKHGTVILDCLGLDHLRDGVLIWLQYLRLWFDLLRLLGLLRLLRFLFLGFALLGFLLLMGSAFLTVIGPVTGLALLIIGVVAPCVIEVPVAFGLRVAVILKFLLIMLFFGHLAQLLRFFLLKRFRDLKFRFLFDLIKRTNRGAVSRALRHVSGDGVL